MEPAICFSDLYDVFLQEGHGGPGSLTCAKIGFESDAFNGIRDAD